MAEQDDERDDPAPADQDRAAILARRQRFVALALSGLATSACTDGKQRQKPDGDDKVDVMPQACLTPVTPRESGDGDGPPPQPCLRMEPPPDPPPQVCLKIAQPEAETGETGSASETGQTEAPEPKPQPCLSVPRPCLRKASPGPCLKMAIDD